MSYLNTSIIDTHIHVSWDAPINDRLALIKKYMQNNNLERVITQAIPHNTLKLGVIRTLDNLRCFYYKVSDPDRILAFAGIHHNSDPAKNTKEFYLEMAKFYMAAGFDGFKMIEDPLKNPHRTPFTNYDCEQFDLFFDYCEKEQIPVTIHTSGPEFCWDEGHSYSKRSLSFMDCYDVFRRLLSKYPKLKLSLAHFFFLSGHIDIASEFLDKYENIYYDLTPNPFMYDDFAKNPQIWKEFFIKYQDRILFGTDAGANYDDTSLTHAGNLVYLVREFLEGTKPFRIFDCNVSPMNFDKSILKKIYHDNAIAFLGTDKPKKPVTEYARKELNEILARNVKLSQNDFDDIEIMKKCF